MPEPNSGCWLWMRSYDEDGYGQVHHNGKRYRTHRLAWELYRGEIPNGLLVLHKCDVTACVNPDHLFLGTVQDNATDRVRKGRRRKTPDAWNTTRINGEKRRNVKRNGHLVHAMSPRIASVLAAIKDMTDR